MAEHLAERLIYLASVALAPPRTAELALYLALYCGLSGLNVRSLVVVLHNGFAVLYEEWVLLSRPTPQGVRKAPTPRPSLDAAYRLQDMIHLMLTART